MFIFLAEVGMLSLEPTAWAQQSAVQAHGDALSATTLAATPQAATTKPADDRTAIPADQSAAHWRDADPSDLTAMSLEDLMNVNVTSVSKKSQSIANTPAAVTVISQDDIYRLGFSSIPNLLRTVPGMDVAQINSNSWAISARGFNDQYADKLLVLEDGRTLYTPLFGGTFWNTVDYMLPDLDRVEVIRGPGATLYGANAVNGVINIVTKDAADTQGAMLDSRFSNGESDLGVRYGGKISDDTYYRVFAKAAYTNDFDTPTGGPAGDDWYAMHGGFRLDKHSDAQDAFTLQGDISHDNIRDPMNVPVVSPPFIRPTTVGLMDTDGDVLAHWVQKSSANSEASLQIYYDYLLRKNYGFQPGNDGELVNYSQHTLDVDFHDRFMLSQSNEVLWGLGYRATYGYFQPGESLSLSPDYELDSLYSGFVQDTLTLSPSRCFLTVGSKLEHNDYTGFEYEPSARLMWTPDKQNSLWAGVSRAVRTPSRLEREVNAVYSDFNVPNGMGGLASAQSVVRGNTREDSEELIAYEMGYRIRPTKSVSIDLSTFYNTYDKLSIALPQPPELGSPIIFPSKYFNAASAYSYGGEIAVTVEVTPNWRLSGSYSLFEIDLHAPSGTPASVTTLLSQSAPTSQAQLHSYWDMTRSLQLNAGVYYTDHVPAYGISSYISTDLNLNWRATQNLSLQVGVEDLFDSRRSEYGPEDQSIRSDVPRTLYAEMTYKF